MKTTATQSPHVAVIIPTMNQKDKTLRCLASFRDVRSPRHTLIVWDNGSADGTAEAVRAAFPKVLVHWHPINLGAAGGRNAGAALAIETFSPSHFMFVDNDSTVTPDFLDRLIRPLEKDDRIGQTVPKMLMLNDPQRIDAVGVEVNFWSGSCAAVGQGARDTGQFDKERLCVADGHFLTRVSVFQEIGGFDTKFDPYGYQGIDFSLCVQEAGYKTLLVPESVVLHEGSRTPFKENRYSERYVRLKTRNSMRFMRKHATPQEQIMFFAFGLPYVAARAVVREGTRGNLLALGGVFGGIADLWRSRTETPGERAGKR